MGRGTAATGQDNGRKAQQGGLHEINGLGIFKSQLTFSSHRAPLDIAPPATHTYREPAGFFQPFQQKAAVMHSAVAVHAEAGGDKSACP
jgi:hypothetical protein